MNNVAKFPDRLHLNELDSVGDKIRAVTLHNPNLTAAEAIAVLEMVKMDVMNALQRRFGVDEE